MAAALAEVPFAPTRRFRVNVDLVAMVTGLVLGSAIAVAGGLILAGRVHIGLAPTRGFDAIALGFLVGSGPAAFVIWRNRRRLRRIDERLPDFLTDVASLHKAGLTLQDSITTSAEGSYGPLDGPVRTAAEQLRWNLPILSVLENLQRNVGTRLADRTFAVVIEASRAGGNVPEVLEIAAGNARSAVRMREVQARSMGLYTIITYVASLVFVGVALAMQTIFVPKMIGSFGGGGTSGLGLAASLPSAAAFRNMFYVSALVQAAGNGIVGGIMSEGSPGAGLRHSWVMVALCAAGFAIVG